MKRIFILIAASLFVMSAAGLAADEAVLIDFNKLSADIMQTDSPDNPQKKVFTNNRQTMMDFSSLAGNAYTDKQKEAMRTSLAVVNWEVVLASSSRTNMNQGLSMTREAKIADGADNFKGQTVMGVRVRFPVESYNSWASIRPPFEIPAFEDKANVDDSGKISKADETAENDHLTRFEGTYSKDAAAGKGRIKYAYGVVKNVGAIKKLAVNIKGLNFPHSLSVILRDGDNQTNQIFVGFLNFDGWREMTWENPGYVKEVRNRQLRISPTYPKNTPFVKLDSILIQRDGAYEGGDFITYIKDIKIIYDKAVLEPDVIDINDEDVWGIVKDREDHRKKVESGRFGQMQVLRYLENLKQEKASSLTPSEGQKTSDSSAAPASTGTK